MESKSEIKLLTGVYLNDIIKGVGLRMYPLVAPEQAGNEYIVYQRNSLQNIESKGRERIYPVRASYTITIVSDSYANSLTNAATLINAMTDYSDSDVADIRILDCSEAFSENYYLQSINIELITI